MGIFDKLFGKKQGGGGDQPTSMPWDERPSIYDHVRSHVDPVKSRLTEGGETLPDEDRINTGSQIRWAAGAMDGVATHHMGTGEQNEQVQKTVKLVLAFCGQPTAANKAVLYQNIIDENTVSIIDPVIEAITGEERINHQRLCEYSEFCDLPNNYFVIAERNGYWWIGDQESGMVGGACADDRENEIGHWCLPISVERWNALPVSAIGLRLLLRQDFRNRIR